MLAVQIDEELLQGQRVECEGLQLFEAWADSSLGEGRGSRPTERAKRNRRKHRENPE